MGCSGFLLVVAVLWAISTLRSKGADSPGDPRPASRSARVGAFGGGYGLVRDSREVDWHTRALIKGSCDKRGAQPALAVLSIVARCGDRVRRRFRCEASGAPGDLQGTFVCRVLLAHASAEACQSRAPGPATRRHDLRRGYDARKYAELEESEGASTSTWYDRRIIEELERPGPGRPSSCPDFGPGPTLSPRAPSLDHRYLKSRTTRSRVELSRRLATGSRP